MKTTQTFLELGLCSLLFSCILVTAVPLNDTRSSNVTSDQLTPLIVGGMRAGRTEFPWLVNLRINMGGNRFKFCGGALIQLDVVLTAAHCVYKEKVGQMSIYAGDHDIQVVETGEQILPVKSVKWHEKYDEEDLKNDIAIIKLKGKFNATSYVSTIKYTTSKATIPEKGHGTVAGWGTLFEGDNAPLSRYLMKVDVPIVPNKNQTCSQLLYKKDSKTQFCAGTHGKDSCQGDSGGPIVCSNMPGQVCGIVSYGVGCGRQNSPGVYTKVSEYEKWIKKNNSQALVSSLQGIFASLFFVISYYIVL